METRIDPRVVKTHLKLKKAFLKLLSEKSIQSINVKDLTTTASVTRGTFYLHFKDKETFVCAIMEQLVNELFENTMIELENDENKKQFSISQFLTFVEEHPELLTTLLNDEDALQFRNYFENELYLRIENYREVCGFDEMKVPKDILTNFLLFTLIGYVEGWLNQGKMYATAYMSVNLSKALNSELIHDVDLTDFFSA